MASSGAAGTSNLCVRSVCPRLSGALTLASYSSTRLRSLGNPLTTRPFPCRTAAATASHSSSSSDVPQVTPSVGVRLQLVTEQVAQGDVTQAEPLLQTLTLQRFT
ncbi:hypothetical protein EYF80_001313 [Liparis tanakae]|uniref:Uncharacterized protein n=1 Tax=Liparis tanakae TaxID=230148 RepID=A0A4Z2JEB2_9TELE|nr:hypothetical protein EYF80_001313 [Liparis tanakae]